LYFPLVSFAGLIGGLADTDVILVNETGLDIARLEIDARNLHEMKNHDKILVSVTPKRHHLHLVFRGGGDIDWPRFDFIGVHEIFFERDGVGFKARFQ
jgi:hypothetical protein